MAEPVFSLAEQAVMRLRRLTEGNGLAPDFIQSVGVEAKDYVLKGELWLTPVCDATSRTYSGRAAGKGLQILPDRNALQAEAQKLKEAFMRGDWFAAASEELKAAAGAGWGLDGAAITMPDRMVKLAATEPCPSCQGQAQFMCATCEGRGYVTCPQCRGLGKEFCYHCSGRGDDPIYQGQPCSICHGTRYIFCRTCRSQMGQMVCPACQGRRGTVCTACKGAGAMTEEVTFTGSVTTQFTLKMEGAPSGLRRGLDRLGAANLVKGYADISRLEAKEDAAAPDEPEKRDPVIHYQATLPYADVTLRFNGGRAVVVGVFGKRGVLLNVPPFLDEPLKPWREKLRQAGQDGALFDAACAVRAVSDAVSLVMRGQGNLKDFRRLYPYGLSAEVMQEMLGNARRALGRLTFRARLLAAGIYGVASAGLCGGLFLTPLHTQITQGWRPSAAGVLDGVLLLAIMALGILVLTLVEQRALQKRFPERAVPLRWKLGKTGGIFLAALGVMFGGMRWLGLH